MAKTKMTSLQEDVDFINRNAHLIAHVLIGFAFAHLLVWFNWILVLSALLILVGLKEFFVDAYVYKHPFDTQLVDAFEYFCGFAIYVFYLYLLIIFPSTVKLF